MNKLAIKSIIGSSCLALISCILNPYHLLPGLDIFHSSFIAIILALGMWIFFSTKPTLYFPKSTWTWLTLFFLILLQPIINNIFYPDTLIFPLGNLLICILLSIVIASLSDTKLLIRYFLYTLIICLLLSTVIQLMQFNHYVIHDGYFLVTEMQGRFDGNFFQPNQMAFMFDLGLVALMYFYYNNQSPNLRNTHILLAIVFLIFSFSIGLTLSQGGLLMAIAAIVGYALIYNQKLGNRIKHIGVLLTLFMLGYYSAIWCYQNIYLVNYPNTNISLVRMDSLQARLSLQQRAWELFREYPLTGIGWHKFSYGGIDDAIDVKWFFFSEHSHFLFSQIASELGLLGLLTLLPILWLLLKKLNFKQNNFTALCYVSIGVFLLYSFSEYPLWYLRFLYIFVILIAILDTNKIAINKNFNKIFAGLSIVIGTLSVFYMVNFWNMYKTFNKFEDANTTAKESIELYRKLHLPFGFSSFKELMLFNIISVDSDKLKQKIELGNRVLTVGMSKSILFKQGQLQALDGQKQAALINFKASCALDWKGNCSEVNQAMERLANTNPTIYGDIAQQYQVWEKDFDPKKNKF